jgi:hypothetical protein
MDLCGHKDHCINKDKQRINKQSTWLSKIECKNPMALLQHDIGTGKPSLICSIPFAGIEPASVI